MIQGKGEMIPRVPCRRRYALEVLIGGMIWSVESGRRAAGACLAWRGEDGGKGPPQEEALRSRL